MTLVLSAQARGLSFQVADRLVSLARARSAAPDYVPHDEQANKNVVLLAADALVSLGYTGIAYLSDGRPTDRWIAEEITGASIDKGMGGWGPSGPMHLEAVVDRLVVSLRAEFSRLPPAQRKLPLEIAIVGQHRRRRNQSRPLLWRIANNAAFPGNFTVQKETEPFRWDRGFRVDAIGSTDPSVLEQLRLRLKESGAESPTAFRNALVEAVRGTSSTTAGVGADCMTIVLNAGAGDVVPNVDVEYVPASSQVVALRQGDQVNEIPGAYSPYLIVPGWIWTPAVIESRDDAPWHLGGITVRLRAPSSPRGAISVSGQSRRSAPGRHRP